MKHGIDRLCSDMADLVAAEVRQQFEGSAWKMDSPIERLFDVGFRLATHYDPRYSLALGGFMDRPDLPGPADFASVDILMQRQVTVVGYRADFVISASRMEDQRVFRLVVECDGHDFHERTKQQAARDRSRDRRLQAEGFTVMRFTGSELYRDPMRCAREALDWCVARVMEVPST